MEDTTIDSSKQLQKVKQRLSDALIRLERVIDQQNNRSDNHRKIRAQVIKDLDLHIANLEKVIQTES